MVFLMGAALMLALAGCNTGRSGSTTTPPVDTPVTVRMPLEDPTKPTAIGGTIFTLYSQMMDQAYNAEVQLTGKTDAGATYTAKTYSRIRGGYQFTDIPAGTYSISAQVVSPYDAELTLNGTITGVRARGNIPALMTNLLLGPTGQQAVFTGQITQNGRPAVGCIVSVDVTAYTTEYAHGDWQSKVSLILSTNTDAEGRYLVSVPPGGTEYYVAAHSDTSMVASTAAMRDIKIGDQRTIDLVLQNAETPHFAGISSDIVSTTLPPNASNDVVSKVRVTQLATARALHAPASRIARLEKLAAAPVRTRGTGSQLENDLYWTLNEGDTGVRGFHVYRSSVVDGTYTYIGSATDPYLLFFFDNDPGLDVSTKYYYAIASYAANGQVSAPSKPIGVTPLPPLTTATPAKDAVMTQGDAVVTWATLPGAQSYMVLVFYGAQPPTFNVSPATEPTVHAAGVTQESLATLQPGEYWWTVSAYNATDPTYATAAAYTEYRHLTIKAAVP
jgi:hypothetical protein